MDNDWVMMNESPPSKLMFPTSLKKQLTLQDLSLSPLQTIHLQGQIEKEEELEFMGGSVSLHLEMGVESVVSIFPSQQTVMGNRVIEPTFQEQQMNLLNSSTSQVFESDLLEIPKQCPSQYQSGWNTQERNRSNELIKFMTLGTKCCLLDFDSD